MAERAFCDFWPQMQGYGGGGYSMGMPPAQGYGGGYGMGMPPGGGGGYAPPPGGGGYAPPPPGGGYAPPGGGGGGGGYAPPPGGGGYAPPPSQGYAPPPGGGGGGYAHPGGGYGAPPPAWDQAPPAFDGGYQQPGYQQPGYQQPGYQQPGYHQQPPPAQGVGPCQGRKKAVLIGINYPGSLAPLRGCINDVTSLRRFICKEWGFRDSPDCMRVLTDDARDHRQLPTRQNMLDAFHWLVADARPGDSLFLHYSGHGGQKRDLDGDEDDGMDETLCPCD